MMRQEILLSSEDVYHAAILDLGAETVGAMGQLRKQGTLIDFTIKVGDTELKAHKTFMAAISGYFRRHFTEGAEKTENTVTLDEIDADSVEAVLDFVYDQKLNIKLDNISKIMEAARYLLVDSLIVTCANHLVHWLDKENFLQILAIANHFLLEEVISEVLFFISEHSDELKESLVGLPKSDLVRLLDGPFCSESETELFLLAKNWAESSEDNMASVGDVMKHIRFPLMSEADIEAVVEDTAFLKKEPCCQLIEEARNYHAMPVSARVLVSSKSTQIRGDLRKMVFSTGHSDTVPYNDFTAPYVLDVAPDMGDRWLTLPLIQEPLASASVLVINNFLVACGVGRSMDHDSPAMTTCAIFDPRRYGWFNVEPMSCARSDFPLVALGETIVALGGSSKLHDAVPICDVEMFHLKTNTWSTVKALPEKLSGHAACESNGKIYVSGGVSESGSTSNHVWMYTPATDTWEQLADMLTAEQHHAMMPLTGGQLAVISSSACKIFNLELETGQWSEVDPKQPGPRYDACLWAFTPHLGLLTWHKPESGRGDGGGEAAGGDTLVQPGVELSQQPVLNVPGKLLKCPWPIRPVHGCTLPDGVSWRHCVLMTLPWDTLIKAKPDRCADAENLLQMLRNIAITATESTERASD